MKSGLIVMMAGCLTLLSATQSRGVILARSFGRSARASVLIVEGMVREQTENLDRDLTDMDSFTKKSVFEVTEVHKGDAKKGDKLTVFSHMSFLCDTSSKLTEGGMFLLMLERHGAGFADGNYGRDMWEIVTLKEEGRFVVGDPCFGAWGKPYEQFKQDLDWALLKPSKWPARPTVSAVQARTIAAELLSRMDFNLKGIEPEKQELVTLGSDIARIAHSGDPVWHFEWKKSQLRSGSPRLDEEVLSCYVHAHTGEAQVGRHLRRAACSPEITSRLFLKSYRQYRRRYAPHADNVDIVRLSEREFRDILPRLKDTFRKAKPSYPKETAFLRVEFPGSGEIDPAVFVFNNAGHVNLAGIVRQ